MKAPWRCWLGGFLLVAVVALWYFNAPLGPVLIAGAATCLWTWRAIAMKEKTSRRGNAAL